MNPIDDQLDRLFRSAAPAKRDAVPSAPCGLETRALAAWHEGRVASVGFWDTAILVRGLLLASIIMAISFWPALTSSTVTTASTSSNPFSEYLQLTDSTSTSDETQ